MKDSKFSLAIVLVLMAVWTLFGFANKVAASEPIVLGVPSARAFAEGETMENGTILAVEEINAKGGVNVDGKKRPLKVEIMDTRDLESGVPVSEALLVVERLILSKKAKFVVGGPIRTEAYHAAMDLFSKYKTISLVNTGVYSPATGKRIAGNYEKYKYSFRLTGHVGIEIAMDLPQLLKGLKENYGFDKSYIMVQDVAHARKSGDIVEKLLPKWGWKVLGKKIYPTGATDFSLGLLDAKKKGAQFLWIWMDMPEVGILLRQWSDLKVPAIPMGYARPGQDPGFWKATDGKCAYAVLAVLNAGNVPTKVSPWAERFNNAWIKKYGKEPSGYSCSAPYMTVYVLKDAIERANTLETEAVITALEKTDIKEGVYGRIRFDPKSHDVIRKMDPEEGALGAWFQWQDGKRISVFPKAVATGSLKMPPWFKK
ncbi:MAG: ABC transporter substrate-binding protein [Thermodesulfobacteriota bacterium]|nr:ABC transporter substrate-binding protein [Thermodesulfobacteriota bacterium]